MASSSAAQSAVVVSSGSGQYTPSEATIRLFQAYAPSSDVSNIIEKVEQARALLLETYPYKCVQEYRFCVPRLLSHPGYASVLKEHSGKGRVLDLGCCMATDLRQMILDGLCDVQSAIGIDLEDSFIQEGMRMFGDGTGKWPANALAAADVFNKASWPASLTEAQFRVVYSGALFHLFEQPKQAALAATVFADLLEPGGCFFGRHVISAEAASFTVVPENDAVSQLRYLPNRDDFSLMMESAGFTNVQLMFAPADMTRTTMEYGGKAKQYLSFVATKR